MARMLVLLALLAAAAAQVPSGCSLTAPAQFKVHFGTQVGNFTVAVQRSNAPIGADRFYSLVKYVPALP